MVCKIRKKIPLRLLEDKVKKQTTKTLKKKFKRKILINVNLKVRMKNPSKIYRS